MVINVAGVLGKLAYLVESNPGLAERIWPRLDILLDELAWDNLFGADNQNDPRINNVISKF